MYNHSQGTSKRPVQRIVGWFALCKRKGGGERIADCGRKTNNKDVIPAAICTIFVQVQRKERGKVQKGRVVGTWKKTTMRIDQLVGMLVGMYLLEKRRDDKRSDITRLMEGGTSMLNMHARKGWHSVREYWLTPSRCKKTPESSAVTRIKKWMLAGERRGWERGWRPMIDKERVMRMIMKTREILSI